ncbi:MerR family transcriptional regulator [Magnetococcus sp. PR-3]|uniref:MerR family transcriptional regulator n=1 Tax=Magnetococcus sp. PR-3 TaxID=3120355 RepID=UPI002FCE59C2
MERLKIGDVSRALGVATSALRYYENQGVVTPQRSDGGTRFYTTEDIQRFQSALDLAQAGVPIKVIQQLATVRHLSDTGDQASREVADLIAPMLADVRQKAALFARVEADLAKAMDQVQACKTCDDPPTCNSCRSCEIIPTLMGDEGADVFKVIWNPCPPQKIEEVN